MLVRYQKGPDGKPVKKAVVYTNPEHGIDPRSVDADAVRIVERLRHNGHDAYIVGGAVRDLLIGRIPKDYDIVTDAQPQRIKRLFYRSRIIGRRFRLVHVYVGNRIYEVSTFRSMVNGSIGNTYGTIDEDAQRRDFSMNALYFDPLQGHLVDYVGGYKDVKARRVVPVIPLKTIFTEDPVRMLRAVKYAVSTKFTIQFWTRLAIRRQARLLATASVSRLGEEAIKIFGSGKAALITESLHSFGLLQAILPKIDDAFTGGGQKAVSLRTNLEALDAYVGETGDKSLGVLLAFVLRDAVREASLIPAQDANEAYHTALQAARDFMSPLTMPRVDIEFAVKAEFQAPEPKEKTKKPRKRRRRKPAASGQESPVAQVNTGKPHGN
ncbi:MAG: polynucleotide adenylyltransferase PcnB [Clostridia bacterium]